MRHPAEHGSTAPVHGANPGDWPNVYSFRSRHSGGLQFALADGSVRFVTETMPLDLYRNLATIAGGETVNLD